MELDIFMDWAKEVKDIMINDEQHGNPEETGIIFFLLLLRHIYLVDCFSS